MVDRFDRSYELRLSPQAREDLVAYLEAVGSVDRVVDDRALARKLDQTFAYAALLTEHNDRVTWVAAIDAINAALVGEPKPVAERVAGMRARLDRWRARVVHGDELQDLARAAPVLRRELARLAADWAGAIASSQQG